MEKNMKTKFIGALLVSALCAGPALAQSIYDSPETIIIVPRGHYTIPRAYDIPPGQRLGHRTMLAANAMTAGDMQRMEGKTVFGSRGDVLGTVMTVDIGKQLAQVQTPGGVSVAMPIVLLQDKGDRLYAPTTSQRQMAAMAVRQTGTHLASDVSSQRLALAD
jgi:hypothetical protein